MSKTYLTKQGLDKLKEEHNKLLSLERVNTAKRIKEALESGGYEENPVYAMELEKQIQLERRISELEDFLREGTVIEVAEVKGRGDFVTIGALVVVEADGEKDQFRIVGSFEANPVKSLISNESPVGQALLGAKVGDVVEVTTPVVKLKYKLLEIRYD